MTHRRTICKFVVPKPPDEVIRQLEREGWPRVGRNVDGTRVLFLMDRRVTARASKYQEN